MRGYEEREVSADVGYFTSLEAWSAPLFYDVRAVGFVDVGHVRSRKSLPGELTTETLWGAGLGARWFWRTNLSVELDLALPFNSASTTETGEVKAHFNAFYRF